MRKMHDGTPSITFTKIWHDDDVVELAVHVRDDASSFTNNVYVDQVPITVTGIYTVGYEHQIFYDPTEPTARQAAPRLRSLVSAEL